LTFDISMDRANVKCQDLTPFIPFIMFTGASGGHIMPALAFRKHFPNSVLVAVKTSASEEILKGVDGVMFIRPLALKKIKLSAIADIARVIFFAREFKPEKILCFGSYLNAVGTFCAKISGVKLYFFEPNAVPGKGTSLLKYFADEIFEVFPGAGEGLKKNTVFCKFPVSALKYGRDDARGKLGFDFQKPVILILGGSQGSGFINDIILRLLPKLGFAQIIHITGSADFGRVNKAYNAHRGNHLIFSVSRNMPLFYSAADTAVSRAGAGTLAELAFYKIPSLLIPYPLAAAHQERNADFFSKSGAAIIIKQRNVTENNIFEAIEKITFRDFWKFSENLAKISLSDDGSDLAEKISGE